MAAPWAHFHVIPEMQPGFPQRLDTDGKIRHAKDDPIPAARLLMTSIRQWTRARGPGTAEQHVQTVDGDVRESR
jgi:hypothetical protein